MLGGTRPEGPANRPGSFFLVAAFTELRAGCL